MPSRGRPRSGTSRMDAAIHAMKQFGFDDKEYVGHYGFIESDAYSVLLEALLADQDKESQKETEHGETSKMNEIVEDVQVEESYAIVPTVGLVDIPPPSPSPPPLSLAVFLPPLPPALEAPPPPPPPLPPALEAPPPPPPPVLDAGRPLPLPPATPAMYAGPPPPGFGHQYRRRKPCYGWITNDDEESQFIQLPSSVDWKISPPKQRSSWDLSLKISSSVLNYAQVYIIFEQMTSKTFLVQ